MQTDVETPIFITDKRLARAANMSVAWFRKDRLKPKDERQGPDFVRVGGAIRYPVRCVDVWLERLGAK